MFNYDQFIRAATAAVGALILSTLSVGAAVGPAHTTATDSSAFAMVQDGTLAHG